MNEYWEPVQSVLGWRIELLLMVAFAVFVAICNIAWNKWGP